MTTGESLLAPPRRRPAVGHVPGEAGIWILILEELTMFAVLFAVYVSARADDPDLFRLSQDSLHQSRGVINTLLLLTSSVCVAAAVRSVRTGQRPLARPLLLAALACGLGFLAVKALDYGHLLSTGHDPGSNEFFMNYFQLTGLHLFHLIIGLGVLVYLWRLVDGEQLTDRQVRTLEVGACYWHMVDTVWIVIFPLLYLVH
jgi:nitric oxide reductase NorE protein